MAMAAVLRIDASRRLMKNGKCERRVFLRFVALAVAHRAFR